MTIERLFFALLGVGALVIGFLLIDDVMRQRTYRAACRSEGVSPAECLRIFP